METPKGKKEHIVLIMATSNSQITTNPTYEEPELLTVRLHRKSDKITRCESHLHYLEALR